MSENENQEICLNQVEAVALASLLWNIAGDPSTDRCSRGVDASHHACLLQTGLPPAPTHTEPTNEVKRYFERVVLCLKADIELRRGGQSWSEEIPGHFYQENQVGLAGAPSVAQLLWEVAIDETSKYQTESAFFACLIEHKIGEQLALHFGVQEQEFYEKVIESLKEKVQQLTDLSSEQLKNRPKLWPPPTVE